MPTDLYSLLYGDEDSQAKNQALAQALRNQQAAATQLMLVDPQAHQAGSALMQSAQQQQEQMSQAPGQRLRMAMGAQDYQKQSDEMQAATERSSFQKTPQGQKMLQGLYHGAGIDLPEGAPPSAISDKELSIAAAIQSHKDAAAARAVQLAQARAAHELAVSEKQGQFDTRREDALVKDANDVLNQYKPRTGLAGYTSTINRVNQIKGQVLDPTTGRLRPDIDNRQMAELAITLQQAVANGHASESEAEMLLPKTIGSDSAKIKEYFTNHRWNADQQDIAASMLHSAENAANVAHQSIIEAYQQNMAGPISGLRKLGTKTATDRANSLLRAHGINPEAVDDNGLLVSGKTFALGAQKQTVGPHGNTLKQGNHTYTWNPQKGEYE